MKRSHFTSLTISAAALAHTACGGPQSALDAAGIQGGRLESLWWIFFWVTASVYVIVMAVLLAAVFRTKRAGEDAPAAAKLLAAASLVLWVAVIVLGRYMPMFEDTLDPRI